MPIPWTAKKQLIFFVIFALIIAAVLILVWLALSKPSCFDNKQNQDEEGIDCGGPCEPCLGEIKNLITVWSKPFELESGRYDAAALVENPNLFLALPSLKYKFKLYDSDNILVAVRQGETFINPGEQYVIFETDINTGERVPARAFVEFKENPKWKRIEKEKPRLVVSKKIFINKPPFSRLIAEIDNKTLFALSNISAVAVLYDGEENAIAASATKIDSISGNSSRQLVFTWPKPFSEEPVSSRIFLRTDLTR